MKTSLLTTNATRSVKIAEALLLTTLLAGCAGAGSAGGAQNGAAQMALTAGGSDPTTRFVACLRAEGVGVTITDEGFVAVQYDHGFDSLEPGGMLGGSTEEADGSMSVFSAWNDAQGTPWVVVGSARYFESSPNMQDIWLACEAEVPDFRQLTWNDVVDTSEVDAMLQAWFESALAFAGRARAAGFEWVADPAPGSPILEVPPFVTEPVFRAMLEAAWEPDMPGFAWAIDFSFDIGPVLEDFPTTDGWSVTSLPATPR